MERGVVVEVREWTTPYDRREEGKKRAMIVITGSLMWQIAET